MCIVYKHHNIHMFCVVLISFSLVSAGKLVLFCSFLSIAQVERSKMTQMTDKAQRVSWTLHEFLLCTDSGIARFRCPASVTVCPLYSPFNCLLRSSFRLCSCVFLRSNCLLKWESLSSLCLGLRWKRNPGWHRVASADGGSHGVSLSLPAKIPQQW